MPYVITEPCIRDGACAEVCPVECIVPGPEDEGWPTYFIDPDTCIDCGACVPECPYEAIFPEEEVPFDYEAPAGVWITNTKDLLDGAPFEGEIDGHEVKLLNAKQLEGGEAPDPQLVADAVAPEMVTSMADQPIIFALANPNPDIRYDAKDDDPEAYKRKVIRGGSWKDIARYLQVSTRDYEYQDSAKSFIGFRCVRSYLGDN